MPKQEREGRREEAPPGRDVLFDLLHQEHEAVDRLLTELLTTDETPRARELWKSCAVALALHARTEQDVVYDVLERDQEDRIREARAEHEQIEDLLANADAAAPGTDEFFGMIAELQELVRRHVQEEERTILPKARQTVDERERAEMVEMFRELASRLRPKVEAEFAAISTELGEAEAEQEPVQRRRGRAA